MAAICKARNSEDNYNMMRKVLLESGGFSP